MGNVIPCAAFICGQNLPAAAGGREEGAAHHPGAERALTGLGQSRKRHPNATRLDGPIGHEFCVVKLHLGRT